MTYFCCSKEDKMSIESTKKRLKDFWQVIHERLSSLQEDQFDRGERELIAILGDDESKSFFPVPATLLMVLVWSFILFFPLIILLDPSGSVGDDVTMGALGRYYLPLLSTMLIFFLNQRILVPKFFFKKKYVRYFVCDSILFVIVLFCRELYSFLTMPESSGGIAEFFGSYCFRTVRDHFSVWTLVSFMIILSTISFLCIIISVFSRQLIRAFIIREKKKVALEYELDFLKSQLSPHFLFNTLNNITSLIRIEPKLAESSMEKLSKLLRVMLYQTSDKFIDIKDDVDLLQKYGELEKLRLPKSFEYVFETDLENPHCQIPPLLMMPLVENAMKHCVNPDGKSFAHIRISQKDGKIHFKSVNSNFPRKPKPGASGLGLATFEKRLELLFSGKYSYGTWIEGNTYVCDLTLTVK